MQLCIIAARTGRVAGRDKKRRQSVVGAEETRPGRAGPARSHSPGYLQTQVEREIFLWKEEMVAVTIGGGVFPSAVLHQQPQNPQAVGKTRNYRPTLFGTPFIPAALLLLRLPFPQCPSTVCRCQSEHPTKLSRKRVPLSQAPGFSPSNRVRPTPCL